MMLLFRKKIDEFETIAEIFRDFKNESLEINHLGRKTMAYH
jgi:hypothetical protein